MGLKKRRRNCAPSRSMSLPWRTYYSKGCQETIAYSSRYMLLFINNAPESDSLNRFIRRSQEGWHQEETSRFCGRENNQLNEGVDNER